MSTEREALAALLKDAEFFVRDYATRNPRWTDGLGHTQDPNGAHALANKLAAALAQPAQEPAGAAVQHRFLAAPQPQPATETEAIDRLYLELSQFTQARTGRELAMAMRVAELTSVLRELVELKDIKLRIDEGNDPAIPDLLVEYMNRKPKAWQDARDVLAA